MPQLSIVKGKKYPLIPKLLHKTFEELVDQKYGDQIALIFHEGNDQIVTNYNTLNSTSNRIASALLEKIHSNYSTPNTDGDWIICVCMKPSDELVTVLLAIWKCGGSKIALISLKINVISVFSCISSALL